MSYQTIQSNIDASAIAAINATTEEERILHTGDVLYWKMKKDEYVSTHTLEEAING